MNDEGFSREALAAATAEVLGARADGLRFRRISTGLFNTSFFVDGAADTKVIRVAPADDPKTMLFYEYRMMRQEPALHAKILQETDIPVPRILGSARAHPLLGRDFLVMEKMSGTPLSQCGRLPRRSLERLLAEVGRSLRRLHGIHGRHYGYVGDHRPMEPQRDWASAFAVMWNKLIDDNLRCGGYSERDAAHMRSLLDRHYRVFERPVPASLLHMDVWAQNILTDPDGNLTGLLDWDRALWGDPEIEFAVLDYCSISQPAFWAGYGRAREESPEAEIRRVFYLLYEVQKYIFIRSVRGGSRASAKSYRLQCLQLARRLE